ncbi:MAG TPA: hypothetical protein VG722_11230 [Tepidisphaeraceae bacterium]|nr:hypothetical protein [Tepidisphaeraceae bacterium]
MRMNKYYRIVAAVMLLGLFAAVARAAQPASLLSDDPCNQKWHIEPTSHTIVFIGTESHPTKIAFRRSELAKFELSVDADSNKFSIMSGFVTIDGQWPRPGKNTLTFNAVGDSPYLLVDGAELPAFKGRWAAISLNNKDQQVLLEFPGANYANLKFSLGPSQDQGESAKPAPVAGHPTLAMLRAQLSDAEKHLADVKRDLLVRLADNADYQSATAALDKAKTAMQSASQNGSPDDVASAATKQMDAQAALERLVQQLEAADPKYSAASSQLEEIKKELLANDPLLRSSWNVTVVGKPPIDTTSIQQQITTQLETVRQLGPTETPPVFYDDWGRPRKMLTPTQIDAISAAQTRNAQRQSAHLKLEALQKQLAEKQNTRQIAGTLDDGSGVSIFASGSACAFADSMQVGGKYTIKGSASMMSGVLRINLASAVPAQPEANVTSSAAKDGAEGE